MDCPKCKSQKCTKDGVIKKKQRYRCKNCNYRYTVAQKSTAKSKHTKRQALALYLEGLGFRSIGRFLNVSHVSVNKWIKSYTGKIWIAVDRNEKRFVNCVFGGIETGKGLWEGLKEKHVQSKAETFTFEGYNSLFRHFLVRLRKDQMLYKKS